MTVLDDFAAAHPQAVVRSGNAWLVDASSAPSAIAEATRKGVKVLGLEGFLVDDGATYPALSRIADFSKETDDVAVRKALALLNGDWSDPPTPADQMHRDASGRHMIAVVLAG